MDTLRRPELRHSPIKKLELLAYALLTAGFVLMVLGIFEVGGLFNVGLGFAMVWIGYLTTFANDTRLLRNEEDEFRRQLDDL
jgi:membrane-bound ClpP family serine protease